jgi:hypothetical protein
MADLEAENRRLLAATDAEYSGKYSEIVDLLGVCSTSFSPGGACPTGLLDSLKRSDPHQTANNAEKRMGGVPIESVARRNRQVWCRRREAGLEREETSAPSLLIAWACPYPTNYATGANSDERFVRSRLRAMGGSRG